MRSKFRELFVSMSIADYYGPDKTGLSFELYPPKTPLGAERLLEQVDKLVQYAPDYITCTYGAGGSTQESTLEIVSRVRSKYRLPVATHLTCVGSTTAQIRQYLARALELEVRNVVALRGDPPRGEVHFKTVEGGLSHANELVTLIRSEFPEMGIAVAGYPEIHQEASGMEEDLLNLRRKVEAGADLIITQLFYNNDDFFRFRDACVHIGIDVPIVPGLLPVTSWSQIERITSLCGAALPAKLADDLRVHETDPGAQFEVGVKYAARQAAALLRGGVAGLHFFVLNKSGATSRVLDEISLNSGQT
jgi:methylenetetrahydrofolate reductase (NADH)